MRRRKVGSRHPRPLHHPPSTEKGGLWAAGIFSLLLHITLIILLTLSLKPTTTKMKPSFYRVTLRPFAPHGDGSPLGSSLTERPGPTPISPPVAPPIQKTIIEKTKPVEKTKLVEKAKPIEKPKSVEKAKPVENQKGSKMVEGLKLPQKKSEKKVVTAQKEDLSEEQKDTLKNLQEALADIRKKAALDEIKKNINRRETSEEEPSNEASSGPSSQGAVGSGSGTGTGSGTGSAGSPTGGSPWGSRFGGGSALDSKLNDYYDSVWEKIKKEWTLPENLRKGRTTLETTVVIVVDREGKVQKSWFERKSGDALFDQRAMRAIKKAEPLPPIPKELTESTLEMGFRFHPD
jgi:colicin import membrane protein